MARYGLIGPSYTTQSPDADDEYTQNWYPEILEAQGKSAMVLYPTPGTASFGTVSGGGSGRGVFSAPNGRVFAAAGGQLSELASDGTETPLRGIPDDGLPVSFASSDVELLVSSGGKVFVMPYATSVVAAVAALNAYPIGTVVYIDGYFIAMEVGSNQLHLSGLLDGTTWDPADIFAVSTFAGPVIGITADHRELWVMGRQRSQVYYNSGDANTPFQPIPGAMIENGVMSMTSLSRLDNTVFWWDRDERGGMIARRANGYTPQRVSNHAIEYAVQGYGTFDDVEVFSYQDQGHTFFVSYFPTAKKTLVFDAATNMWCHRTTAEVDVNGNVTGKQTAWRWRSHCYGFNKHLVSDWNSANVYQGSIPVANGSDWSFVTDSGLPITRERRAPVVAKEYERIWHKRFVLDMETGLAPIPPLTDGAGNPRPAQITLNWSKDGGHTFGNDLVLDCGEAGEYGRRVFMNRLGQDRHRVYRIVCNDPIPWRITDGYITDSLGELPVTDRLAKQLLKSA